MQMQYLERSLLLLGFRVTVRTIKLCSVLSGLLVDVCHRQDSLMRGGLHHKWTSTLRPSAIN